MSENLKEFSKDELALHNGRTNPTIYVGYKGLVYDVTSSELFKGGKHYFHDTGIDLTQDMDAAPHLDDVMAKFSVVGRIGSNSSASIPIIEVAQPVLKDVSSDFELILEGKVKLSNSVYQFYFNSNKHDKIINRSKIGSYLSLSFNINNAVFKRSYSIANVDSNGIVELLIQEKQGGVVSEYLIHSMKLGEKLSCNGVFGGIDKSLLNYKQIYFLCTDVGIAPVLDIIHEMNLANKNISATVLVGDRYREDACYHNVFSSLNKNNEFLMYKPYLSREKFVNFNLGYITDFLKQEKLDLNAFFVVVGWNRMVNESKSILANIGIKKESIYVQMYT